MIVFFVRDGRTIRKAVTVLPAVGRFIPGHGEVWKIERDEHKNIVVHCR